MSLPIPLFRDQKSSTPLIEIYCGDSLAIFATTSKSPVSHVDRDGNIQTFLPEPSIGVNLPKQDGGLTEDHCEVTIPMADSQHPGIMTLAALLSTPRAVPPTSVRIRTIIKSAEDEEKIVYLYEGVLDKDSRNPENRQGVIEMSFLPDYLIYLEESTLGRRVDSVCDAVYGKSGCWVDTTQEITSPTVNVPRWMDVILTVTPPASDRVVTLALDRASYPIGVFHDETVLIGHDEGWWVKGYLEKDGLRISISDWRWNRVGNIGTNIFILARVPPESWDGASLELHPGCQRTPEACFTRQGNYDFFGGLGYGIPAYNPTLEEGDK